jgi:hypothetical protein
MVHGVPKIYHTFKHACDMYENGATNPLMSLPSGVLCPFNAQGAMHLPEAYFALLLPCSVTGRVTDIWRSFIAETILTYIPHTCVTYTPAHLDHQRNAHNYQKDFNSEINLYQQTPSLLGLLTDRMHQRVHDMIRHESDALSQYESSWTSHAQAPLALRDVDEYKKLDMPLRLMLQLYVELYEHGVVEMRDVQIAATWVRDIQRMQ